MTRKTRTSKRNEENGYILDRLRDLSAEDFERKFLGNIPDELLEAAKTPSGDRLTLSLCFAHILRLYAPVPPYSSEQLDIVFETITRSLLDFAKSVATIPQSADAPVERVLEVSATDYAESATTPSEVIELYELLLQVDAMACLTPLYTSGALERSIFQSAYAFASNPEKYPTLTALSESLVMQVLNTGEDLSLSVVKIVLDNFAGRLAVLSRKICQMAPQSFLDQITVVFKESMRQMDEPEALEQATSLWQQYPYALKPSIPFIESLLVSKDVTERKLATTLVGKMLGINHVIDAATTWPNMKATWLERSEDASPLVRAAWAACSDALDAPSWPRLARQLEDPHAKVRLGVFHKMSSLSFDHLIGLDLERLVAPRLRDTSISVRHASLSLCGELYLKGKPWANETKLSWIAEKVLGLVYIDDSSIINDLSDLVVPWLIVSDDEKESLSKLLHLMTLSTKAKRGFAILLSKQINFNLLVRTYFEVDVSKKRKIANYLATTMGCKTLFHDLENMNEQTQTKLQQAVTSKASSHAILAIINKLKGDIYKLAMRSSPLLVSIPQARALEVQTQAGSVKELLQIISGRAPRLLKSSPQNKKNESPAKKARFALVEVENTSETPDTYLDERG